MGASTKKIDGTEDQRPDSSGERRRLSRVRHDDRGNGYVEWIEAPADLVERPKLEIQRQPWETPLNAHDPYANDSGVARKTGNTTRTDLRKLSAWIKMMRELEERKRDGQNDGQNDDQNDGQNHGQNDRMSGGNSASGGDEK